MKIAIFLGHPAHFHMFKYVINNLRTNGIEVDLLIKRKDILEDLVKTAGFDYVVVRSRERNSMSKLIIMWQMLLMDFKVCVYLLRKRPNLLIGTYSPVVSGYLGVPIIVCNEDDANAVPRFARLGYPRASVIIAPSFCDCGKWEYKAVKYSGFQKLAYLHPNEFSPSLDVAQAYLRNKNKPYILMRFSKFIAHHDNHANGISNQLAYDIVKMLEDKYDVYITSERPLNEFLERYRVKINPLDIHHLMAFSTLYIGDSQSMSVEAAMLGVPCIRFNSFVGTVKVGVLEELEEKYHLIYSIHSSNYEGLVKTISSVLSDDSIKEKHKKNRERMISEKIDVSAFLTWLITNYPESVSEMKIKPEIQNKFK